MSKKNNFPALPEDYALSRHLDLQHDRKTALLVNGLGLLIALIVAAAGFVLLPVSPASMFDMSRGLGDYFIRWGTMLFLMIAYIILHEATHGAAMLALGHNRPHFGFTGLYAFAGSDDYFCKADYMVIALAPAVVWTILLGLLTALAPTSWAWFIYIIQIINISGCCGDFYVSCIVARCPIALLVQDDGTSMKMYLPAKE